MGIPKILKTDNVLDSPNMRAFFSAYGIHITGIPYNSTGPAIIERANCSPEEMLLKQKGGIYTDSPRQQLSRALFSLIFF